MQVQSYLFFDGRCEEALEFYKTAVGAEVDMMMRFKESPDGKDNPMCPPGSEDKILHACFRIGDTAVMGSDGYAKGNPEFKGFSLAISTKTEAEADKLFGALGAGGKVEMPLTQTFFSPKFGMLADKFGVNWMIMVEPKS
jgi:PhnB protein